MDQGNEVYKKVAREQKDYLQASVLILGFFSTFTAPFIISILLQSIENEAYKNAGLDERTALIVITILQGLQSVGIWLLIFFGRPSATLI